MTAMSPLDHARTQLGVVEGPGNTGIPFKRYALDGEQPLPWCARFVRWCFEKAGLRLPGNRYLIARVQTMLEELENAGALLHPTTVPAPGDLLFLRDRGLSDIGPGHHVAFVENCGVMTVNSIDGNWGNAVRRETRQRFAKDIACFARWPLRAAA